MMVNMDLDNMVSPKLWVLEITKKILFGDWVQKMKSFVDFSSQNYFIVLLKGARKAELVIYAGR